MKKDVKDVEKHKEDLFKWFMSAGQSDSENIKIGKMEMLPAKQVEEEKLHEFDFKYLMEEYWRFYNEKMWDKFKKDQPSFWEKDIGEDPIKLWYAYKKIDENCGKYKRFDCDSWNQTNDLMDKIYDLLWRELKAEWGVSSFRKKFGPDTMNSFATTFNALGNFKCYVESYEAYQKDEEFQKEVRREEVNDLLGDYAHLTGCLGNFTLVPKGYNGYRGTAKMLKDYWDLSLHNLRYNRDQNDWLDQVDMCFNKYINMFFLWDYVDEDYHVYPLFQSHTALLKPEDNVLPRKYEQKQVKKQVNEFEEFVKNVNIRIRRRGAFMIAMLRISQNGKEDYKKIVKALANDEKRGSMEQVLKDLEKYALSEEARGILQRTSIPRVAS